jgi:hypothetical protein
MDFSHLSQDRELWPVLLDTVVDIVCQTTEEISLKAERLFTAHDRPYNTGFEKQVVLGTVGKRNV